MWGSWTHGTLSNNVSTFYLPNKFCQKLICACNMRNADHNELMNICVPTSGRRVCPHRRTIVTVVVHPGSCSSWGLFVSILTGWAAERALLSQGQRGDATYYVTMWLSVLMVAGNKYNEKFSNQPSVGAAYRGICRNWRLILVRENVTESGRSQSPDIQRKPTAVADSENVIWAELPHTLEILREPCLGRVWTWCSNVSTVCLNLVRILNCVKISCVKCSRFSIFRMLVVHGQVVLHDEVRGPHRVPPLPEQHTLLLLFWRHVQYKRDGPVRAWHARHTQRHGNPKWVLRTDTTRCPDIFKFSFTPVPRHMPEEIFHETPIPSVQTSVSWFWLGPVTRRKLPAKKWFSSFT